LVLELDCVKSWSSLIVADSLSACEVAASRARRAVKRLVVWAEPASVIRFGARDAHWVLVNSSMSRLDDEGSSVVSQHPMDTWDFTDEANFEWVT